MGDTYITMTPDKEKSVTDSIVESEPELQIRYYEDTDTLVLSGDTTGPNGETVARNLVAMSDNDGWVTSVVLEHAAELLRPILFPESTDKG